VESICENTLHTFDNLIIFILIFTFLKGSSHRIIEICDFLDSCIGGHSINTVRPTPIDGLYSLKLHPPLAA
jgi:hypothetical protein